MLLRCSLRGHDELMLQTDEKNRGTMMYMYGLIILLFMKKLQLILTL